MSQETPIAGTQIVTEQGYPEQHFVMLITELMKRIKELEDRVTVLEPP